MEMNDRVIQKVVGKLIEVLHGEYSDTRDLAVVQLALLGRKAVPFILSFLKKEGDLERDFSYFHEIRERISRSGYGGETPEDLACMHAEEEKFRQDFERKWGWDPTREDYPGSDGREYAVEGALDALALIGDARAIPTLKELPIYDYVVKTDFGPTTTGANPLFEKAKETIDKIQAI